MGTSLMRERGRPKGSRNGSHMIMPWQPLTWLPIYDTMIALHIAGHSYKLIGAQVNYHPIQIGNVIRSNEGQKRIKEYLDASRKLSLASDTKSLSDVKSKAIERVAAVINDDDLWRRITHSESQSLAPLY